MSPARSWETAALATNLLLFIGLASLSYRHHYFALDLWMTHWLQAVWLPGFSTAMTLLSWIGTGWRPWILGIGTGLGLLFFRFRSEGALLMGSCAAGAGAVRLLKLAVARPRPDAELVDVLFRYPHESFPSGHVVFYVQYFGLLCLFVGAHLGPGRWRRGLMFLLLVPIVLVGASRIYLGAHWPSDTIGGYLMGSFWLVLTALAYRRLKKPAPIGPRR